MRSANDFPPVPTESCAPGAMTRASLDDRAARVFVLLAWLASVVVLALWIARFQSRWPWNDDVTMAPFLDAHVEMDWSSYWLPHNEHRIPLVKLAFVALLKATHDFRAGAWLHWGLLSSSSLALLWALRRRTGSARVCDALIPIALLTPGNFENLLSTFQLAFLLPTVIGSALLVFAVASTRALAWRGLLAIWSALVALLLCGSIGFVGACVLALWPLQAGWSCWRASGDTRARRAALSVTIAGALVLGGLALMYLDGLPRPGGAVRPDVERIARVAAEFLTCALGPGASLYWPWTGWIVGAVLLVAFACSLRGWRERTGFPIALQLAAGFALALSFGVGRGNDGIGAGFVTRYVMPSACVLCAALACLRVLGRGVVARVAGLVLFTLVAGTWFHALDGANAFGTGRIITDKRLERSIAERAGVVELARENWRGYFYAEASFAEFVQSWRRAGFFEQVPPGERIEGDPDPLAVLRVPIARVDAAATPELREFDDGPALVARERIELEFDVPSDARAVSVRYGVDAIGRDPELELRFEFVARSGERRLLKEARLAPRSVPGIDPWQVLEASLPAGLEGRVVLVARRVNGGETPLWILLRGVRFPRGG